MKVIRTYEMPAIPPEVRALVDVDGAWWVRETDELWSHQGQRRVSAELLALLGPLSEMTDEAA